MLVAIVKESERRVSPNLDALRQVANAANKVIVGASITGDSYGYVYPLTDVQVYIDAVKLISRQDNMVIITKQNLKGVIDLLIKINNQFDYK